MLLPRRRAAGRSSRVSWRPIDGKLGACFNRLEMLPTSRWWSRRTKVVAPLGIQASNGFYRQVKNWPLVLAAFFLDAYAFSTEGIVGFTIGRKNKLSFLSVVTNSIQVSFYTALIIAVLYFLFFKEIINIITDIEILRFISFKHFIWIVIIPPVASFCYQLDGIFIGASQTKEIRNAMIVSVIGFIATSIYLTDYFENHGLWFSLMLFMILRALTLKFYFNKILRKF